MKIIDSNSQPYVPNCYAPVPSIDLTLICNGEQQVSVMDCLGNFVQAGFDAPTVAPTVTSTSIAGTWPTQSYWNYVYVYAARGKYPLVQSTLTTNGSFAPRSNMSPTAQANSTTNTNKWNVSVPTSSRADIDTIWIYRTGVFNTAAEATNSGQAGAAFFVSQLVNNPNAVSVSFIDDYANISTGEQVELDNFSAPQFNKCIYVDPYFWAIGNDQRSFACTVDVSGLVTLTSPSDRWYTGRNGQIISFAGITSGGYDNKGNYYFKQLSNSTAQLYTDLALTAKGAPSQFGTTTAYIRGPSAILYRSKPRNPFSWGETSSINGILVPEVYTLTVGGGVATAIGVIPNYALLKIDTEKPTACYTYSLRTAGTPNFPNSKNTVSREYSVSTQQMQTAAPNRNGTEMLWGIDVKSFAIVASDGVSQTDLSTKVVQTLRSIITDGDDRLFFHTIYHPKLQILCFFIRTTAASTFLINKMIYYHWPTDQWGTHISFDILCSAKIVHPVSRQEMVVCGSSNGFIGTLFDANMTANWVGGSGSIVNGNYGGTNQLVIDRELNPCVGVWSTIIFYAKFNQNLGEVLMQPTLYYGRVSAISNDPIAPYYCTITFDIILDTAFNSMGTFQFGATVDGNFNPYGNFYLGMNEMKVGKFFNAGAPFTRKKPEEIWVTSLNSIDVSMAFGIGYQYFVYEMQPIQSLDSNPNRNTALYQSASIWSYRAPLPFDYTYAYGLTFVDRSFSLPQLMNMQILLTPDGRNA